MDKKNPFKKINTEEPLSEEIKENILEEIEEITPDTKDKSDS